jgi:hypothetical protein
MDIARVLISTSRAPMVGTGTSRSSNPAPARGLTIACIVFVIETPKAGFTAKTQRARRKTQILNSKFKILAQTTNLEL